MAGRPRIELDKDQIVKLAAMGCTNKEIAAFFDVSQDTIGDNYSDEIQKGKEQGKVKLRRLQWQAAEKGNVVMLIWLGKQLLDQSEKHQVTGDKGQELKIKLSYDRRK